MDLELPDIATLMEATVARLRFGPDRSEHMRQQLGRAHGLEPSSTAWPRFVNNHAWALVRLQAQGQVQKLAPGFYELVKAPSDVGSEPSDFGIPPIRDDDPLPRWTRQLIVTATWKNASAGGRQSLRRPTFGRFGRNAADAAC